MCGRYAASASNADLVEEFEVDVDATADPTRSLLVKPQTPPVNTPDFNMAPSKQARVILTREKDGEPLRQLRDLTWGLVPPWAKDTKIGMRMINARAETLLEKPAYAKAAKTRRCLIPADGWYEWQVSPVAVDAKGKPRKQPFYMHRTDGAHCAFAGIYDFWRDKSLENDDPNAWLVTFSIITTTAGEGLNRIHDRQPLTIENADWNEWLSPELTDPADVHAFLRAGRSEPFTAYPVSTAVSRAASNGPGLLHPIPTSELDGVVDPSTGEILGA